MQVTSLLHASGTLLPEKKSLVSIDNVRKSNELPNIIRVGDLKLEVGVLAPWSRVLLEKLTGLQLVKKFPTFYGTQMFITAFTGARHLSLS
jgi:hypothetical protein